MLTCYYFWNLLKWIQGFNSCFFLLFNFQGPFSFALSHVTAWLLYQIISCLSTLFSKKFQFFSIFFWSTKNRINKPFFSLLSCKKIGLASKHCKHYNKKCNKKEHADVCLDLFFDMLLLCCFFFFGKNFLLCHRNILLFNIVLLLYYISSKNASIVFILTSRDSSFSVSGCKKQGVFLFPAFGFYSSASGIRPSM